MANWIVTRKVARTEAPNYPPRAAQTVDATVATWIPVTAALLGCFVTPARAKLDSRYYESPTCPVSATLTVDATVRTWIPAPDEAPGSYVTAARARLDVRQFDWHVAAPISQDVKLVDANVRTWAPASSAELASYRVKSRPRLDVRKYDWTWQPVLPPAAGGPSVAQTFPAMLAETQAFRTAAAPKLDLSRASWDTGSFTTPPTWATWVPLQDTGGRTRASAPQIDVRGYEWSSPAWQQAITAPLIAQLSPAYIWAKSDRTPARVPRQIETVATWLVQPPAGGPTIAQTLPAIVDTGGRLVDHPRLDVRGYEWTSTAWITATLPAGGPTVAQIAPVVVDEGGRTRERDRLDVRRYDWASSGWLTLGPFATVAQTAATWQDTGGRLADHARLDLRAYEWGGSPGWIVFAPPPPAQLLPAFQHQSARTADRATFDVRRYEWSPEQGWILTPVSAALARQWPAILQSLLSFRSDGRALLDVRRIDPLRVSWPLIFPGVQPRLLPLVYSSTTARATALSSVTARSLAFTSVTARPITFSSE